MQRFGTDAVWQVYDDEHTLLAQQGS